MKFHKNMIDPKKLLQANQIKDELLKRCPRYKQNEGNFMYDKNGNLKCFDMQQYDYTKT